MASPTIDYVLPVSRSFGGMKRILFQPFDIGKWFVLGFTAWLAALADGGGSSFNFNFGDTSGRGGAVEQVFHDVGEWIERNMELAIAIGLTVFLLALALGIVLLWISSRGKFMFLDNVVHNRALVKDPWSRFKTLGNSLFLWRLVFGLIAFTLVLVVVGVTALLVAGLSEGGEIVIVGVIVGGLILLGVIIVLAYITLLLENFVVPIMCRESITATAAWKRFLPIHGAAFGHFILYALWVLLLGLAVGIAVAVAGFATCCIGFIILAIPYIGTVILLPVSVFFRLLGPEFLRQFGSDYDIFPPAPPIPQ